MEQPIPQISNFINNEISDQIPETLTGRENQSVDIVESKNRMGGGADNNNTGRMFTSPPKRGPGFGDRPSSELENAYRSNSGLLGETESSRVSHVKDGPMCFCVPQAARSTGEKKTDEMFDYAIKNLNEAEKALKNLGENFENDLKLMFMDIMARVQHWVSIVNNRIYAARADLEPLRKETIDLVKDLSAKDLELAELRIKSAETEENLAKYTSQEKEQPRFPDVKENPPEPRAEQQDASTLAQICTDDERIEEEDEFRNQSPVILVNAGCQSARNRERGDRETELKAELAKLHEENDRMMKERTEYENAVQCALLKGVSSLNVEALKVLRCPPAPCCTPCESCSPRSTSPEPVVTNRPRTTRCDGTSWSMKRHTNIEENKNQDTPRSVRTGETKTCCHIVPDNSLYCKKGRKKSPENVILLLHDGDTASPCQICAPPQSRRSGSGNKRESVCVGGKCGKTASTGTKEKNPNSAKSAGSGSRSYDAYVRHKDDTSEKCTMKKNTVSTKRCSTCNRNRTYREEP